MQCTMVNHGDRASRYIHYKVFENNVSDHVLAITRLLYLPKLFHTRLSNSLPNMGIKIISVLCVG